MPFQREDVRAPTGTDAPEQHVDRVRSLVRDSIPNVASFELRGRRGHIVGSYRALGVPRWNYTHVENSDIETEVEDLTSAVFAEAEHIVAKNGPHQFQLVALVREGRSLKEIDKVSFSVDVGADGSGVRDDAIGAVNTFARVIKSQDDLLVRAYKTQEQQAANYAALANSIDPQMTGKVEIAKLDLELKKWMYEQEEMRRLEVEEGERRQQRWDRVESGARTIWGKLEPLMPAILFKLELIDEKSAREAMGGSGSQVAPPGFGRRLRGILDKLSDEDAVARVADTIDGDLWTLVLKMGAADDDEEFRNIGAEFRKRAEACLKAGRNTQPILDEIRRQIGDMQFARLVGVFREAGVY